MSECTFRKNRCRTGFDTAREDGWQHNPIHTAATVHDGPEGRGLAYSGKQVARLRTQIMGIVECKPAVNECLYPTHLCGYIAGARSAVVLYNSTAAHRPRSPSNTLHGTPLFHVTTPTHAIHQCIHCVLKKNVNCDMCAVNKKKTVIKILLPSETAYHSKTTKKDY